MSRLRKLECPHKALPVVGVHDARRRWVERLEASVCGGSIVVDLLLDPRATLRLGAGRDREVGERGPQVEARSTGDDGGAVPLDELVHRRVRQRGVRANGSSPRRVSGSRRAGSVAAADS